LKGIPKICFDGLSDCNADHSVMYMDRIILHIYLTQVTLATDLGHLLSECISRICLWINRGKHWKCVWIIGHFAVNSHTATYVIMIPHIKLTLGCSSHFCIFTGRTWRTVG